MATLARSGIPQAAFLAWRLARRVALAVLILGSMLMVPGTTGRAFAQADAFSVEVAVADRGTVEREAAYAAALRRVLLANSGDKTLMNRNDVRAGLDAAESYVETYRYRSPEPGSLISSDTPVTESVRQSGEATGLLLVRFDRVRVLGLIGGAESVGAADEVRPRSDGDTAGNTAGNGERVDQQGNPVDPFAAISSALVWLVIDDDTRTIRGTDPEAQKVRERMREIAGGAGVTLLFPDEGSGGEVEARLGSDAIRLGDEAAVRDASLRYRADVILTGHLSRIDASGTVEQTDDTALGSRVRRAPGVGRTARVGQDGQASDGSGWQGNWIRLAPDAGTAATESAGSAASERTRIASARLDEALRDGVAWLAGDPTLGQPAEYVYGGGGSDTEALVRFYGIGSLGTYADVLALLEGVTGVASVWPKQASGDSMVFAVWPRSALGEVATTASAASWLRRSAAPVEEGASDVARNVELAFDVLR